MTTSTSAQLSISRSVYLVIHTHQRDEVGEREREVNIDDVLVLLDRPQLFDVSLFFKQVVDETFLLVPAPAP